MRVLHTGEYTGEIVQKMHLEDAIITNTVYSARRSSPEWHSHENLHVCFVYEGGRAETKKAVTYTQPGGSLFFYHAGQTHRWVSPRPVSKSANLEVGNGFIRIYDLSENRIKEALRGRVDAKAIILKIQHEMLVGDGDSRPAVHALLLELFTEPAGEYRSQRPRWANRLRDILHDEWDRDLSLHELGLMTETHPVTLSKFFRKYFSCTLGAYRRKIKVARSIDLIKGSAKSLSEIAHLCNFSDHSHFTRTFKASTGFLPKSFRSY
ncbi:MAG: AraC family transcriptional regulator [Bacteroidota bacterium]